MNKSGDLSGLAAMASPFKHKLVTAIRLEAGTCFGNGVLTERVGQQDVTYL
jgi:hypothetical protein